MTTIPDILKVLEPFVDAIHEDIHTEEPSDDDWSRLRDLYEALSTPAAAEGEVQEIVAWLRRQSDLGANRGNEAEKGTTKRAAFGGGSLALARAADMIESGEFRNNDNAPTPTQAGEITQEDEGPIADIARIIASWAEGQARINVYKSAKQNLKALQYRSVAAAVERCARIAEEKFAGNNAMDGLYPRIGSIIATAIRGDHHAQGGAE